MTVRILIMGLPGSGKTTFARQLLDVFHDEGVRVGWLNADIVRKTYDDWDFSPEGRLRQSLRMRHLADTMDTQCVIADFVCPTKITFDAYDADTVIWMNTISEGRFTDTNAIFEDPPRFDFRLDQYADDSTVRKIAGYILRRIK